MKLWAGRFQKEIDQKTNDFNSSIAFDSRMAQEDIAGSMAHAAMLAQQGILSAADGEAIRDGLAGIAADLRAGTLIIDPQAEDIHTFIEGELTACTPGAAATTRWRWTSACTCGGRWRPCGVSCAI